MDRVFETLIQQWEYDIAVMSQPWMYWYVMPIAIYMVFFLIKWMLITFPAWMPLFVLIRAIREK